VKEELAKFNDFDIHLTAKELLDQNPRRGPELNRYVLNQDDLLSSSKCQRLRILLPELVAKGHRVLIFSVWTTCLDLLSCLLEVLDMKYLRMEGSTAVSERQSLIDEFNRDASIPIFLLSTKACGLGINLTAADVCIMHDIDFNPFNDLQAEDRCHRIGQKKPVQVIKLVAKDTVDEDIHSMQERKAKMSAAIMESSSSSSSTFESKKERDNVFQTAVDRYLASPHGHKEKENLNNALETDSL
jgi:SWI/SNF-related matrix-associated actin-dependent regulator 1 of chromatin subfamily A